MYSLHLQQNKKPIEFIFTQFPPSPPLSPLQQVMKQLRLFKVQPPPTPPPLPRSPPPPVHAPMYSISYSEVRSPRIAEAFVLLRFFCLASLVHFISACLHTLKLTSSFGTRSQSQRYLHESTSCARYCSATAAGVLPVWPPQHRRPLEFVAF